MSRSGSRDEREQANEAPELGRLVPGCRADFIVVQDAGFRDQFDAAALASTRPLATLVDGEVVHRSASFDA